MRLQPDGCGSHLELLFEAQHPQGAEAVNQSGRHVRKGGILRAAQDERTGSDELGQRHVVICRQSLGLSRCVGQAAEQHLSQLMCGKV